MEMVNDQGVVVQEDVVQGDVVDATAEPAVVVAEDVPLSVRLLALKKRQDATKAKKALKRHGPEQVVLKEQKARSMIIAQINKNKVIGKARCGRLPAK